MHRACLLTVLASSLAAVAAAPPDASLPGDCGQEPGWFADVESREFAGPGRPFREIQVERQAAAGDEPIESYPTLEEVYEGMQAAASRRPDLCRFVDLTEALATPPTEEGRHLFAVKISSNVELEEDEPATLLVSLHHSNEVVTPLIALYAMDRLVDGYGADPAVTAILDGQEVWIAPVWNPDGYAYVFEHDSNWRKNRSDNGDGTFGVDLNRNYPMGWDSSCAGSTDSSSSTYKGAAPASEVEVQTMMAWTERERFARVLDFHSYGRITLHGYRCLSFPLWEFFWDEAERISLAAQYPRGISSPSAMGEQYQWQLSRGAFAFLLEAHVEHQPPFESGQAEAEQVYDAALAMLERPITLTGIVQDKQTGEPLDAEFVLPEAPYANGETMRSASFPGRYHLILPDQLTEIKAMAPGYEPFVATISLDPEKTVVQDFELMPLCRADLDRDGELTFFDFLAFQNLFAAGDPQADFTGDGALDFFDFLAFQNEFAAGCP